MAPISKTLARSDKTRPDRATKKAREAIPAAQHDCEVPPDGQARYGSALPVFHPGALKLNMTWYFFLGPLAVLAGLAASLVVIYQCILKFRRRKNLHVHGRASRLEYWRLVDPPSPRKRAPPSPFSQLCESMKDAPPKEQASRVREHFGIVGGARPGAGQGRKGKRS
jgi:hypothetical protein